MQTKILSLAIIGLLFLGIIAAGFVLAETESEQEVEDASQMTLSENSNADVAQLLSDDNSSSKNAKVEKTVTVAEGWVVESDNLNAEIFRATWTAKNLTKGKGTLAISTGKDMEKFKLIEKSLTANSASFYVVPVNSKYTLTSEELTSASVGTLDLTKKDYTNLAIYTGTLVLTSGKYSGTWDVDAASKTFKMKNWKSEGKPESGEDNKKPEKEGFWKRVFGFGKNKDKNKNNQPADNTNPQQD